MATTSSIEWTEMTWNPVTGCTKVSQGCKNCYAERMAKRLVGMSNPRYRNGFELALHDDLVDLPRNWSRPRRVFVNSMSDLFHEGIPLPFIERVFATMRDCPQHTFQILTKRSERLAALAPGLPWPNNIWMGVSVEDERVLHRVHDLASVPAYVRFLSCEPLLGPLLDLPLRPIHWVIVGGESGPKSRAMQLTWVRSIRAQCRRAGSAFFMKQLGGRSTKGNALEQIPGDLRIREYPTPAIVEKKLSAAALRKAA